MRQYQKSKGEVLPDQKTFFFPKEIFLTGWRELTGLFVGEDSAAVVRVLCINAGFLCPAFKRFVVR